MSFKIIISNFLKFFDILIVNLFAFLKYLTIYLLFAYFKLCNFILILNIRCL